MRRKTLPILFLLMLFAALPLMSLSVKAEKLEAPVWGSQKKWANQFSYAYGQAYNSPTWPGQGILYSSGFQVDSYAYYSFTLPPPPYPYLDVGIYGKALSGNGLAVYVWNWATSSWDFVATTPTAQGHNYWGVNPTNHVSGSYEYRLRVYADDSLLPYNDDRYDMWYIDTYYQYTPTPYSVTIWSFLINEGWITGVPITMDGVPTGYTTAHTFTGLTGTHTFTVPSYYAPYTASFSSWNPSGITSTSITVNSGGTWTAQYKRQTTTCSITVTSPNGGESWVRGTTHPITWTWTGSVGANVYIQLLKSGVVKGTITTANTGSYSWTIGTSNLGTDYKIRITSTSNSACTDVSNNYFTITSGGAVCSITVLSPNGGESWKRGTTHPITWTSSGAGSNVYIQLLKSGVVKGTITTANDGYYDWTIGTSHLGSDYQIRITSTSNSACTDVSNNYFTITT